MRYLYLILLLFPLFLYAQTNEMMPYLQTPSSTSMYICWLGVSTDDSIVQYGTTASLGSTATGSDKDLSSSIKWHWVKLINLNPNTRYYYKCITDTQSSAVYSFTTVPAVGTPGAHIRIVYIGDTQYEASPIITNVAGNVAAIQAKFLELYGTDWRQKINLICHTGDIVQWTGSSDPAGPFVSQYFASFSSLTSSIPSMVSPGNHDYDSGGANVIYDFLKAEEICGTEGEKYYSFDLADARFIFMNSNGAPNGQGTTQLNWLSSKLSEANSNSNIDFVFGITHHYGHSEIVPPMNTAWVQNSVIPAFNSITKPTMLAYGHAHCYERGTAPSGRTRLLCDGGGGADLDRWGGEVPQDYPEIHIALDDWMYTIVDIDVANHSYTARTFSIGNANHPLNNVEVDSWTQAASPITYDATAVSAKATTGGLVKLISSPSMYYNNFNLMSSQIQVSTTSMFTTNLVDISRNWEDIFQNTGDPSYTPIDVNAGIDLKLYKVPSGILTQNNTYYWRVRYRSQNTDWGNWSNTQQFVYTPVLVAADFSISNSITVNVPIQFSDNSVGDPTSWSWDFDGNGTTDSSVPNPTWTYSTSGIHLVTLIVRINGINYTITKQVSVTGSGLSAPTNVKIRIVSNDIHLSWNSVPGATSYKVYYFIDPNNPNNLTSGSSTLPQITLPGLATSKYKFFRVVAVQ